ncbi:MAG TPA: molybdenum cofactor biosynthesis protein B [Planctomycetota bacterium]|nr:molybdenum cofactor biosynthesis protein B [Planctomycetota bacterium]
MSVEEHRKQGLERNARLRCAVVTVSDTRTLETDESGLEMAQKLSAAGHEVVERTIVPDEPARIALVLRHWLAADVDAVLLNGGTGIAARDGTVEVVRSFLDRELEGFGELFRMLSYEQVGAAAMLSRALGGVSRGKAVFALPGSRRAVELGMEKLVVPELRHVVFEVRKLP